MYTFRKEKLQILIEMATFAKQNKRIITYLSTFEKINNLKTFSVSIQREQYNLRMYVKLFHAVGGGE